MRQIVVFDGPCHTLVCMKHRAIFCVEIVLVRVGQMYLAWILFHSFASLDALFEKNVTGNVGLLNIAYCLQMKTKSTLKQLCMFQKRPSLNIKRTDYGRSTLLA